ncbi:MAG TPA: succinate dehydrogenase, cytochrome b556 subunit [Brevundimonas sp.]|jgi:succinate dehydrogenase / fumarate reductase cytochrome b subunit
MSSPNDSTTDDGRYVTQPNGRTRPLSPHLQVWRWHVTMTASILFRITIGAISVGAAIMVGWLAAVASGAEAYAAVLEFMASPFGLLAGFGLTVVLFSFILNGARHLINDTGNGLTLRPATLLSNISVWGPIPLAVLFWVALFATGRIAL